ncbi:hypothetical protein KUL17_14910 [Alteromonas sp. KUL17]|uniref:HesA/MoeB/ThiF family protein n=1 Tax=Alteromonas sp. KUL17 TaxID=2480796 RepID=UPI0010375F44|nr:ThiF family adenylyltransferase [Alteromonas sp. KUL17]TAP29221.1 HesA/MoeB/ThiF family protein [Alteromonas sp. KUL17]GEA02594.1 hypothetical protein KUL17_14910 [Alteromonas sp. KUL17]
MNSSHVFHFNPFSLVTRVNDEILINTFPSNQVRFSSDSQPIVDFFLGKDALQADEVLKLIAPTRLDELLEKKVLIPGTARKMEGRYSRQLGYLTMISDAPDALHQKLQNSHALILGAGAIGSHTCWNLAAIGVGKITLVDFDHVEESNFNRQLMYTPDDLGKLKVDVLGDRIRAFNPEIEVISVNKKITSEADIVELVSDVDVAVKAIDTPDESMDWVNNVCVRHAIPYVTGGFLDTTAVVGPNYLPGKSTCFACQGNAGNVRRLHGTGPTFGPLTTLVTSMLSMIAFKMLIGKADGFANRLYIYNADNGTWDSEMVEPAEECKVCGAKPKRATSENGEQRTNVLTFRTIFVAMLTLTVILGQVFEQPLVGVLALFGVFASIPIVKKIYHDNPLQTRREFFVMTCIYMCFSLAGLAIDALYREDVVFPDSLRASFDALQIVSATFIQATLSIAMMFLMLCAVMEFVPKLIKFLNEDL